MQSAREQRAVHLVETELVHLEHRERTPGGVAVDRPVAPDLGVVAHPLQQAVRDAGRPAGARRDLTGAVRLERHAEDARGPHQDQLEILGLVVVEAGHEAEPVAQRAGDEPGAGGRPDEREAREVQSDRAGRRALADHDVELEVLHRRVEHLFDRTRQAVDLVDEEDVAVLEVGQDRGEVARALERRTARDPQRDLHLGRDDAREARLPGAGRPREQQVVDRLCTLARRAEQDLEVLLQLGLADELVEPARPQRRLLSRLHRIRARPHQLVSHLFRSRPCGPGRSAHAPRFMGPSPRATPASLLSRVPHRVDGVRITSGPPGA